MLTRENQVTDPVAEGIVELAERAKQNFGYCELRKKVGEFQTEAQIRAAFESLGLKPFTPKTVEKYKKWKIALAKWHHGANVAEMLLEGIANVALCVFVAGIIGLAVLSWWVPGAGWVAGGMVATGLAVIFAAVGIMGFCTDVLKLKTVKPTWERLPLGAYHRPIPEFVLQTACDLYDKCPNLSFYVDELKLQERPFDPFLVVVDSHRNEYYLEVWNEPKFRGSKRR